MKLQIGERLQAKVKQASASTQSEHVKNLNNSVYVVGGKLFETPWFVFHRGKKVFRNAKAASLDLEETTDDECLDVVLKTIKYTQLTNASLIKARRNELATEAKQVLGVRKTNLIPEPLDLFYVRNTHDVFRCVRSAELVDEEPVLVIESVSGETLSDWRKRSQPNLTRCLAISAEILKYLNVMHAEGLVMHAIHPTAFWIDDFDQVHHIGSDASIKIGSLVRSIGTRLPTGYCDIGLEQIDVRADMRSDLFAWAGLTYFLVTGECVSEIVTLPDTRFPGFSDEHRLKLGLALANVSDKETVTIGQYFGVDAKKFTADFPRNLCFAISSCLQLEHRKRADSVLTLLRWIERTPPLPVEFALAISNKGKIEDVLVVASKASTQISIRNSRLGLSPGVTDTELYEGPISPNIQLRQEQVPSGTLSVFTKETEANSNHLSVAVPMQVLELTDKDACEAVFEHWFSDSQMPGDQRDVLGYLQNCGDFRNRLRLLERMLQSQISQVRSWALSLIENRKRNSELNTAESALLTDYGLRDSDVNLRLKAARLLVTRASIDVNALVEVAYVLGRQQPREAIRCVRRIPWDASKSHIVSAAIGQIANGSTQECPECKTPLPLEELDTHLQETHGYVEYDLDVVSLRDALRSAWRRLFEKNDNLSVLQLEKLLHGDSNRLGNALLAQVEANWLPAIKKCDEVNRVSHTNRLAKSLSSTPQMRNAACLLLKSSELFVRALGRETLLQEYARKLFGDTVTCAQFMKDVDVLTGGDSTQTSISICAELARRGASTVAAFQAVQEYQLNEPVSCSSCNETVARRQLRKHERQVHQRYTLNGESLSFEQMVAQLFSQLLSENPQLKDVELCLEVLQERLGEENAVLTFVEKISPSLLYNQNVEKDRTKCDILAGILAQCKRGLQIAEQLSQQRLNSACALGLLTFSCLDRPWGLTTVRMVSEGVCRRDISAEILALVVQRLVPKSDKSTRMQILASYAKSEGDKLRAIEMLRALVPIVGRMAEIDSQIDALESSVQIRCPLCENIFNGKSIGSHLETVHQKVWEGRQVRSAWTVALDRLHQYADELDEKLLREAERLATISGGDRAVDSLKRYALQKNIATDKYLPTFITKVKQSGQGLCRSCYESVADPSACKMMAVSIAENELKSDYAKIAIESTFPYESIRIAVSDDSWRGEKLYQWLSKTAKNAMVGGGSAVLAILCLGVAQISTLVGGVGLMVVGSTALGMIFLINRAKNRGKEELLTIAWDRIIAPLLKGNPNGNFESFLVGFIIYQGVASTEHLERANKALNYLFNRLRLGNTNEGSVARIYQLILKRHTVTANANVQIAGRIARDLLKKRLSLDISDWFIDLVTMNGELLKTLPLEELRELKWHFINECYKLGFGAAEVEKFASNNSVFRYILHGTGHASRQELELARLIFELPVEQKSNLRASSAFDWLSGSKGRINPFRFFNDLLLFSNDGAFLFRTSNLMFNEIELSSISSIRSEVRQEFVQTGWTHQRVDGGPDLRYKVNPPLGHMRVVGYTIYFDRRAVPWGEDPSLIIALINEWRVCCKQLRSQADRSRSGTPNISVQPIPFRATASCDRCSTRQIFVRGELCLPI